MISCKFCAGDNTMSVLFREIHAPTPSTAYMITVTGKLFFFAWNSGPLDFAHSIAMRLLEALSIRAVKFGGLGSLTPEPTVVYCYATAILLILCRLCDIFFM